jgi:hypothetical protein
MGLPLIFYLGLTALLLAMSPRPAAAQTCSGSVPFNLAPTQIAVHAGLDRRGRGAGASVGRGGDALFGVASAAVYDVDGGGHIKMIGGALGTDRPLSPDNRFRVCPTIAVAYRNGANGTSADANRIGVSVAGDVSMVAVNTPRLWVVPTIGLDIRYNGAGRTASLFAENEEGRHSTFTAGVGFVFSNRLSLAPRVVVPFRSIDSTAFQMTVGYNLLGR